MIHQDLARRAAAGNPIRIGVSGAGWIGSGFVAQVALMQGMRVDVLAEADTRLAFQAYLATGLSPQDIIETDGTGPAEDAIRAGKRVVTEAPVAMPG